MYKLFMPSKSNHIPKMYGKIMTDWGQDFGLAVEVPDRQNQQYLFDIEDCGTRPFFAPEQLPSLQVTTKLDHSLTVDRGTSDTENQRGPYVRRRRYGTCTNIWQIGMIMYCVKHVMRFPNFSRYFEIHWGTWSDRLLHGGPTIGMAELDGYYARGEHPVPDPPIRRLPPLSPVRKRKLQQERRDQWTEHLRKNPRFGRDKEDQDEGAGGTEKQRFVPAPHHPARFDRGGRGNPQDRSGSPRINGANLEDGLRRHGLAGADGGPIYFWVGDKRCAGWSKVQRLLDHLIIEEQEVVSITEDINDPRRADRPARKFAWRGRGAA
ncbi:hypothetical protein BJ875DRAFT_438731 [Amylocarpus encephaloides]|uniref:Protein kinase domain-containing protein n=1 Tax=Amylocarpus encephaloides TaxID=45428 RepID=A0A9P8C7W9_9HELO|nr:hypothetical protein BJ875DRAFT_438731 [Amylocarpus encephaloides]